MWELVKAVALWFIVVPPQSRLVSHLAIPGSLKCCFIQDAAERLHRLQDLLYHAHSGMDRKYDVIFMTLGGRTILGHSGKASTMGKPTGDDLRHRIAIFWFSILRVSTAIARTKMTFPDAAS